VQDFAEAAHLYRLAAEKGHIGALNNLARLYRDGKGVPQDYIEAMRLFRAAADKGVAMSMHHLAYMLQRGMGLPPDPVQAAKWLQRFEQTCTAEESFAWGCRYMDGRDGCDRDQASAVRWLSVAGNKGHPGAASKLDEVRRGGMQTFVPPEMDRSDSFRVQVTSASPRGVVLAPPTTDSYGAPRPPSPSLRRAEKNSFAVSSAGHSMPSRGSMERGSMERGSMEESYATSSPSTRRVDMVGRADTGTSPSPRRADVGVRLDTATRADDSYGAAPGFVSPSPRRADASVLAIPSASALQPGAAAAPAVARERPDLSSARSESAPLSGGGIVDAAALRKEFQAERSKLEAECRVQREQQVNIVARLR
jgi:hypothetical protein